MLRTSTAADIPALQALWQHCFGDPPAYTRLYFAHLWQPEQEQPELYDARFSDLDAVRALFAAER